MADTNLNLTDAFSGIGEWIDSKKQQDQANQQAQQIKFQTDHTAGTSTFTGPTDLLIEKVKKATQFDQIQKIYEERLAKVQAQQAYQQKHPFATALSELAASMASTDRNSLTRGIGLAALRLNPTQRELGDEELNLAHAIGQLGNEEMTRKFQIKEFEEREADRREAGVRQEREFGIRETELKRQHETTEAYRSEAEKDRQLREREAEKDRQTRQAEDIRHHKETEREAQIRLKDAETKAAEAKNKGTELKQKDVEAALSSTSNLIKSYDSQISAVQEKISAARARLEEDKLKAGSPDLNKGAAQQHVSLDRAYRAAVAPLEDRLKKLNTQKDTFEKRLERLQEKVSGGGEEEKETATRRRNPDDNNNWWIFKGGKWQPEKT